MVRAVGLGVLVALLVVLAAGSVRAEDHYVTVALDLSHLSDEHYAALDGLALEKRLVVRLVEEGFAVVAPSARPDIVLRIEAEGEVLILTAIADGPSELRRLAWERSAELELLHLELAQKVSELARQARTALPPPPAPPAPLAPPAPPREAASAPSAVVTPSTRRAEGPAATLALEVGAAFRIGAVDPVARLGARVPLDARWLVELGCGALAAGDAEIHVLELEPVAGVGGRLELHRWSFSAGLRAGALIHRYSISGPEVSDAQGVRLDAVAGLPLRVSLRALGPLRVEVAMTPTVASRGRSHLLGDTRVWHRSPGRLDATVGLALDL